MLTNKKVYVGKHSKEIQEKAFKLGWSWELNHRNEVDCLTRPFLYFTERKHIKWGSDMREFLEDEYKEITAEEILAMEVPKPKKTIRDLYPLSGFRVMEDGRITEVNNISPHHSSELWNTLPTQEEAEAYKILPMLLHFRDRYNEGWKADWEDSDQCKHILRYYNGDIEEDSFFTTQYVFAFKTPEIRDKFLEDFREELEIVKPLL